jgi:sulfate transport system permease protein
MSASNRVHLPGWAPLIVLTAVAGIAVLVLLPLVMVFVQALARGMEGFVEPFRDPDTWSAIRLTLLVAAVSVPLNAIFGLAAAWAVARFEFTGKSLLMALIDLPFSVSPVISGLVWVLLFGAQGYFGPLLDAMGVKIIFTFTGLVLATVLITLPFVARELIPLMQEQGADEEAAALTLGAGGWSTFFRVTLPNVKWALLYGVLLCNARAMGEFGAVSVVSGHIRGLTNTLPLHVEILYNEYDFVGAFAVATLLAGLGLLTLVVKSILEWRFSGELAATRRH